MTAPIVFPNSDLPDIIELRNITQSYDKGKTKVLDGLNYLLEDTPGTGQFDVILGPSGCGKSTLLRYIAGLQKPTSGEVLIKGKPRLDTDTVGMVFQQYSSFPWLTVLENVRLGLDFKGVPTAEGNARAKEAIEAVSLTPHIDKYAKYPTLSGGQLQRVAIARSLVVNPEILLLDEPFGALDTNTRFRAQSILTGLWQKLQSTMLFVTHDIPEAVFLANRIFVMRANPGQIAYQMNVVLPFPRTRETKRMPEYHALISQLEEQMTSMDAVSTSPRA